MTRPTPSVANPFVVGLLGLLVAAAAACGDSAGARSGADTDDDSDATLDLQFDRGDDDTADTEPDVADMPADPVPDPPAEPDAAEPDIGLDPGFVGTWMVDQPLHALYEYTLYHLHVDGQVEEGISWPEPDSGGHPTPTGRVARCLEHDPEFGYCTSFAEVECLFGDAWHSRDGATLVLAGDCTDDQARDIVLALGNDGAIENLAGYSPTVVSVGGEEGWEHNSWDWRFVRCAGTTFESCQ